MDIQKLIPAGKDYLWGGTKLKEKYGKNFPFEPCAESWELSFHPDGKSRVEGGAPLDESVTKEISVPISESSRFFPFL